MVLHYVSKDMKIIQFMISPVTPANTCCGNGKKEIVALVIGGDILTANAIAYLNLLENQRANQAREAETHRSNVTNEGETFRHNNATESNQSATLRENARHNAVTEEISRSANAETARSHKAQEAEVYRHNVAGEEQAAKTLQETFRHNSQTENVAWYNAEENKRHNQSVEGVNWYNAQENKRHNQESEATNWYNAYENERAHKASEEFNYTRLAEDKRHNVADESLKTWQTQINAKDAQTRRDTLKENVRYNDAKLAEEARYHDMYNIFNSGKLRNEERNLDIKEGELAETTRAHEANEKINKLNAVWGGINDSVRAATSVVNAITDARSEARRKADSERDFLWKVINPFGG